ADAAHLKGEAEATRKACKLLLIAFDRGDIGVGADDAARTPIGIPFYDGSEARYPDVAAIGDALAIFHGDAGDCTFVLNLDLVGAPPPIVGMKAVDQIFVLAGGRALRSDAAHRAPSPQMVDAARLDVGVPHALPRAFERHLPAALALFESRAEFGELGDVA